MNFPKSLLFFLSSKFCQEKTKAYIIEKNIFLLNPIFLSKFKPQYIYVYCLQHNYTELTPLGSYICVKHHYTYVYCLQHKYTLLTPLGSYICVERGLVCVLNWAIEFISIFIGFHFQVVGKTQRNLQNCLIFHNKYLLFFGQLLKV